MDGGLFRAEVAHLDAHADVLGVGFGVVDGHLPEPIFVEYAGVDQFVFGLILPPSRVGIDQVGVGKVGLGVVISPAQPGVCGRGIEIPPILLGVLAVVALVAGQAEHALLQNRVLPVPKRQRQAEPLTDVTDAGHAVFAPPIGPAAGMIVGEVFPRGAVRAVVLPHGSPRAFTQVCAPPLPDPRIGLGRTCQSNLFSVGGGHAADSRTVIT